MSGPGEQTIVDSTRQLLLANGFYDSAVRDGLLGEARRIVEGIVELHYAAIAELLKVPA